MTDSTPLRRIMAATDFSPAAGFATRRARLLCEQLHAGLVIVHAVDPGPWVAVRDMLGGEHDLYARIREDADKRLAAEVDSHRREGWSGAVEATGVSGPAVPALLAASDRADLLVVGATGERRLRDLTFGSTAEHLSRLSRCPLLVARGSPAHPYRQVLVPVDFSPASDRALDTALSLAPGAAFHLLHCIDLPYRGRMTMAGVDEPTVDRYRATAHERAMDRLRALASHCPHPEKVTLDVREADVRMELLAQAAARSADLICLGKQGQSRVADAVLGSVTASTLSRATCDVLVAPAAPIASAS